MRSFAFYREKFLRIFFLQPRCYRLLTENVTASKQNNFVCIVIAYRSIIGIVSKNISLRKLELSVRRKALPYQKRLSPLKNTNLVIKHDFFTNAAEVVQEAGDELFIILELLALHIGESETINIRLSRLQHIFQIKREIFKYLRNI